MTVKYTEKCRFLKSCRVPNWYAARLGDLPKSRSKTVTERIRATILRWLLPEDIAEYVVNLARVRRIEDSIEELHDA